jgi:hypothetical protein
VELSPVCCMLSPPLVPSHLVDAQVDLAQLAKAPEELGQLLLRHAERQVPNEQPPALLRVVVRVPAIPVASLGSRRRASARVPRVTGRARAGRAGLRPLRLFAALAGGDGGGFLLLLLSLSLLLLTALLCLVVRVLSAARRASVAGEPSRVGCGRERRAGGCGSARGVGLSRGGVRGGWGGATFHSVFLARRYARSSMFESNATDASAAAGAASATPSSSAAAGASSYSPSLSSSEPSNLTCVRVSRTPSPPVFLDLTRTCFTTAGWAACRPSSFSQILPLLLGFIASTKARISGSVLIFCNSSCSLLTTLLFSGFPLLSIESAGFVFLVLRT